MPPAVEKEPTPVAKSTPGGSLSKLATSGPVIPPTVMRPSVMGLPHDQLAQLPSEAKEPKKRQ